MAYAPYKCINCLDAQGTGFGAIWVLGLSWLLGCFGLEGGLASALHWFYSLLTYKSWTGEPHPPTQDRHGR